jgi:hypothetical protein
MIHVHFANVYCQMNAISARRQRFGSGAVALGPDHSLLLAKQIRLASSGERVADGNDAVAGSTAATCGGRSGRRLSATGWRRCTPIGFGLVGGENGELAKRCLGRVIVARAGEHTHVAAVGRIVRDGLDQEAVNVE